MWIPKVMKKRHAILLEFTGTYFTQNAKNIQVNTHRLTSRKSKKSVHEPSFEDV